MHPRNYLGRGKATHFFCETHWTSALWELLSSACMSGEREKRVLLELESRFSPQR